MKPRTTSPIKSIGAFLIAILVFSTESPAQSIVPLTTGPNFHWFGYYDKLEFDPTSRFLLGAETTFEGRTPQPSDSLTVFMLDLENGNARTDLGNTRAWSWQQGCMLQWIPGSATKVIWNDRDDSTNPPHFISKIYDTATGQTSTLPTSIYCLHPDGTTALTLDFERLADTRPGYGYAGVADPNENVTTPADSGIYSVDLTTGARSLIVSIQDLASLATSQPNPVTSKHWVNHLLFNPSGTRFAMLHRWKDANGSTRDQLVTANADGSSLRVVNDGGSSHYDWKNDTEILIYASRPPSGYRYYLLSDSVGGNPSSQVGNGIMVGNGHCTYVDGLPSEEWILNDTYPQGSARTQEPYLFHTPTSRRISLGKYSSPAAYSGEFRCDTHPRSSPDGKKVVIDSPHGGNGRQLYLIDVSEFTKGGVVAGQNQSVLLPTNTVTLSATSTMTGSPEFLWTQLSGPTATITSPSSLETSVTLSTAGTYVFRLTGTTAADSSSDTATVNLYPQPASGTGLVGHWVMNEGSGTSLFDISGNSHHAALTEGVNAFDSDTLEGTHCLQLDGSNHAEVADNSTLSITGPITLAAWVRASDTGARGIVSKYRSESPNIDQRSYNLQLSSRKPQLVISSDGKFSGGSAVSVTSAWDLPLDQWVHLAASYTPGDSMKLYINGTLDTQRTTGVPTQIADTAAPLWIGQQFSNADGNRWKGCLDDVRIYNRALDDSEIIALAALNPQARLPKLIPSMSDDRLAVTWTPQYGVQYALYASEEMDFDTLPFLTLTGDGIERTDLAPASATGKIFVRIGITR